MDISIKGFAFTFLSEMQTIFAPVHEVRYERTETDYNKSITLKFVSFQLIIRTWLTEIRQSYVPNTIDDDLN